jgi:hypothetical protein
MGPLIDEHGFIEMVFRNFKPAVLNIGVCTECATYWCLLCLRNVPACGGPTADAVTDERKQNI